MTPEEDLEVEKIIDCALDNPDKYKFYFTFDDIILLAKKVRELQALHMVTPVKIDRKRV